MQQHHPRARGGHTPGSSLPSGTETPPVPLENSAPLPLCLPACSHRTCWVGKSVFPHLVLLEIHCQLRHPVTPSPRHPRRAWTGWEGGTRWRSLVERVGHPGELGS